MSETIFSICIPTYNRNNILLNNLQCLARNNTPKIEVVISDNASTDETYKTVNAFIKDNHLSNFRYFQNEKNIGPDANFKKVLSLATGKYAMLLGDDDYLKDNFMNVVIPYLEENDYSFVALSSKEMVNKSKERFSDQFTIEEMENFLKIIGPQITFMSIMIFNTNILHETLYKEIFFEDNLYQSFLAILTIKYRKDLKYSIIYYMPFKYIGETSASNYDFYKVFVNNIIELYKFALPESEVKDLLKIYKQAFLFFIFKFTVILKAIGVSPKLKKANIDILNNFVLFRIFIFPCYKMKDIFFVVIYRIFKYIKTSFSHINDVILLKKI